MFDDIHWAEPSLLDVIEHAADWSRDAPIPLLCMARPELLEERAGWGGGKRNATSVHLEPLSEPEADALIENLLGHPALTPEIRERIRAAAQGNPLFVEEMLEMLLDDGVLVQVLVQKEDEWTVDLRTVQVPPAISALLAARLDRLSGDERLVREAASVVGEVFELDAVRALIAEPLRAEDLLGSLLRKDLVRPTASDVGGRDALRFRHILLRDAAYDALPKADRPRSTSRSRVICNRRWGPGAPSSMSSSGITSNVHTAFASSSGCATNAPRRSHGEPSIISARPAGERSSAGTWGRPPTCSGEPSTFSPPIIPSVSGCGGSSDVRSRSRVRSLRGLRSSRRPWIAPAQPATATSRPRCGGITSRRSGSDHGRSRRARSCCNERWKMLGPVGTEGSSRTRSEASGCTPRSWAGSRRHVSSCPRGGRSSGSSDSRSNTGPPRSWRTSRSRGATPIRPRAGSRSRSGPRPPTIALANGDRAGPRPAARRPGRRCRAGAPPVGPRARGWNRFTHLPE